MQNAYISSSITYRIKGCVCYPSNDCYLLNNRASSCSLCTCCSFPINGVSLNPRFSYGFRQSTLIHCSASRKLALGGGDRFNRLPICDVGLVCYNECCTVEESCQCRCSGRRRRRRSWKEGRFGCMVWEERSESCDLGSDETMEAMLSLLSEENDENYVGVRERSSRFAVDRVRGENRGIADYRRRAKDVECDSNKRTAKGRFEYVRKSREDESRLSGRMKGSLRGEKRELRKDGSTCSSCYSVLSSDEIDESDEDFQFNHEAAVESSRRNKNKESRRGRRDEIIVKNVIEQSTRNENDDIGLQEISAVGNDTMGHTAVEAGSNRHSRNVRKNMRTDVSVRQEESRTESSKNRSNVLESHKSDAEMSSASENCFSGRGDNSVLSSISIDETKQIYSQAGRGSSSQTSLRGREESLTAAVDSVEEERDIYSQTGNFRIEQIESRRKSHQLRMSDCRDSDSRKSSISQRFSESRLKNMEESTSFPSSYQEAEEQDIQSDQKVVSATRSTEESQGLTTASVISDSDTALVSNSKKLSERRMSPQDEISASAAPLMSKSYDNDIRKTSTSQRNRKESSTSLQSSFHEAELRIMQTDQRVVRETKSTKGSQDLTGMSATSLSDMATVGSSQRSSEIRMIPQEESSVSVVSFIEEASGGKARQENERETKQLRSREESERLTEISSFRENSTNRGSSSQTLNFDQRASEQRIHEDKETGRNLQVMVAPPPSKIVDRTSQADVCYKQPSSGCEQGDVYSEMPGSGSSTLYEQEVAPSSPGELDRGLGKDHMYEEKSNIMFHEDALGSANRLEESSTEFVRQFVEKLSNEVSISEFQEEKTSSQTTLNYNDEYTQQISNIQAPEDVHSKVHDSRRLSSRSRGRGPSDEIWDVAGTSSAKPAGSEALGKVPSPTESAIVRSGRSLWSIVGDIVRLRWGARSGTHNSTINSGGKTSSNESIGSEAWFSSHDADENDDENVKKGKRSMSKFHGSSSRPSLGKTGTQSLGGDSESTSPNNKKSEIKADAVSSLDTLESSSASKGASSASKEETFSWEFDERRNRKTPSSNLTASLSLQLPPRHLTRSPAANEEVYESDKAVASRSGFMQMEQPGKENPTESSGAEVKDGELKHRKLQRNKQVKTQTFEEWEEAYTLENEQRKTDEIFMKEALSEAKKAADFWEVPVGAILVQHGKIIARGCNLVEDLRDSTAHAEMICIREASKILKTWRLSGTTLYVTLEPCPMCAGAILQARIDTVVWGAPNKLLGADGSWVRLFPGGGEGGSSDLSNQAAGPVHPFHPKMTIRRGILASECADVMQQFFQLRRRTKEKKEDPTPTASLHVSHHPSKFISKMQDMFSIMFCL